MTSDEHDPLGHITEDVELRELQMEKRMEKLELARKEIPPRTSTPSSGMGRCWSWAGGR